MYASEASAEDRCVHGIIREHLNRRGMKNVLKVFDQEQV
jgi:hypothetical protein